MDTNSIFISPNAAAYIRVGAIAIAGYDYFLTLPAEYRFYRSQRSWTLSPGCILFIILRYLSIATIALSNIGYFGTFTREQCLRYYLVVPAFKATQMLVSQLILGIRAVNISRRSTWVLWTLSSLFLFISAVEFFTNFYKRIPVQQKNSNCIGGNTSKHLATWLFYLVAMCYDIITLSISTFYLLDSVQSIFRMTGLAKLMFYDGLIYLVALTAANIFNLILYRASDQETQSSGATVGYVVTWIMSQRILIHLRDAAASIQESESGYSHSATRTRTITRELTDPREISRVMRSTFRGNDKGKGRLDEEYALPSNAPSRKDHQRDSDSDEGGSDNSPGLGVEIMVEQNVTVEHEPRRSQAESHRIPTRHRTFYEGRRPSTS